MNDAVYCQPDHNLILEYSSSLMARKLAPATISKNLAGISFFFRLNGFKGVNESFLVKQALKGYKKSNGSNGSRRPITLEILACLFYCLPSICFSEFETQLFQTAFITAFFAALRISELVAPKAGCRSGLQYADVFLWPEQVVMNIRKSKTDQNSKGKLLVIKKLSGSQICPVKAMNNYLFF